MSGRELTFQVYHYLAQIWAGWSFKVPVSVAAGIYTGYPGGDWVLFLIFVFMMVVDLIFGSCLAIARRRFDPRLSGSGSSRL